MLSKIKKNLIIFMILLSQTTIFGMYENQCRDLSIIYQTPYLPYSINTNLSLLKQLFNTQKSLTNIKKNLSELIEHLKNNDIENDNLRQEYNNQKFKQLWHDFLILHNHSWFDQIIYPHHPNIDKPEFKKYRNQIFLSLHPDKTNNTQLQEFITYINTTSRPDKYMDFIVNPIVDTATHIGSQAAFNIFETTCFLPSILFPRFFSNQETRFFKKNINQTNKEISQCNRSAKILERNIQTRHEELKKIFKINSKN